MQSSLGLRLLLSAAAFVFVTVFCIGLGQLFTQHRRLERRLEKAVIWVGKERVAAHVATDTMDLGGNQGLLGRLQNRWIQLVGSLISHFRGRNREYKLVLELRRAGIPLSPQEYVAVLLALQLVVFALTYFLTRSLAKCCTVCLLAATGAWVHLKNRQAKRLKAFNAQLFDGLTMLSNSLKSGYSFFQAMDVVAKEMSPPLSDEFRNVIRETSVGMNVEDALHGMLQRVPSEDLDLVVTAVLIQRQVGGNLAEILDKIGTTIRERMRLQGEIRTLTAQGRISGVIIAVLPLVVSAFIFVSNPEYILTLFVEPIGRVMVLLAVTGQLIGVLLIRRIVHIQV